MENLGVYDYMKWIIVCLLLTSALRSQDSIVNDSTIFEYRFKISSLTGDIGVKTIEPELLDLFKTSPIYYEHISQYVFNSKIEITRTQFEAVLRKRELTLEYYRKTSLIPKDGTK